MCGKVKKKSYLSLNSLSLEKHINSEQTDELMASPSRAKTKDDLSHLQIKGVLIHEGMYLDHHPSLEIQVKKILLCILKKF